MDYVTIGVFIVILMIFIMAWWDYQGMRKQFKELEKEIKQKKEKPELMTNKVDLNNFVESEFKTRNEILNQEKKYNPHEIKGMFDEVYGIKDKNEKS